MATIDPAPTAPGYYYPALSFDGFIDFSFRAMSPEATERFFERRDFIAACPWGEEPALKELPWFVLTDIERWQLEHERNKLPEDMPHDEVLEVVRGWIAHRDETGEWPFKVAFGPKRRGGDCGE